MHVRIILVASSTEATNAALALKLGAAGIFLKSDQPGRLLQAIRTAAVGDIWIDRRVLKSLADRIADQSEPDARRFHGVSDTRQQKVLLGILGGLSNRRIGEDIGLSESSVKAVVQKLFARAGVKNRSQLVRAALDGSFASPELRRSSD